MQSYRIIKAFEKHCPVNMASSVKKAAHDVAARKRTEDVLLSESGIEFSSLLLSGKVLEGLTAAGFYKPSPIQLKAIPLGRCGLGESDTKMISMCTCCRFRKV